MNYSHCASELSDVNDLADLPTLNCNRPESRFPVFLHSARSFSAVCSAAGAEGSHGKHRLVIGQHNTGTTQRAGACLKKNQNAPRPSEHPPVVGKKNVVAVYLTLTDPLRIQP